MTEDFTTIKAGGWSVFAQTDGPGETLDYLSCHDMDDFEQDDGDVTLIFCPNPETPNKWKIVDSFQGEPSPGTSTITANIRKTQEILSKAREQGCKFPLYVAEMSCGKRNIFVNWDSQVFILNPTTITGRGFQNIAKKNPGDQAESTRSFPIAFDDIIEVYEVFAGRLSIAETTALNDIVFCNDKKCADDCGDAEAICESGAVVGDAPAGSPLADADVWVTTNKGATWTMADPSPFADAEDIASIVCVQIDKDTTRYIVARGTTDVANPAEIAYRDGTTGAWTNVNVGTVNGQYALSSGSLFATDSEHIWLVTTGGYVYFSNDAGVTWTAQTSGDLTAQNLWYIHGSDEVNLFVGGASDTIIRSTDGGTSWATATATGDGGDIISVETISRNTAWVGTSNGTLYKTKDSGTTWTQFTFSGSGTGDVRDISAANDLVIWMLHDSTAPVGTVFRTIDGGKNWKAISTPTNAGLNALYVCGVNLAYAVGEASGGTSVILKIENS